MRPAVMFLLVILVVTAAPGLSEAGTFNMKDVYFVLQTSSFDDQLTLVMVGAKARYEGTVDLDDDNYIIRSDLYSMSNEYLGTSKGGPHPWQGMLLHAEAGQYGASAELHHCTAGGLDRTYSGRGFTVIYHNWGFEERSVLHSGTKYLECESETTTDPGTEEEDPGPTPILVDLDRGGFRLSSLADGVSFDLDDDGAPERVAWTLANSGDAWLVLDRNGNGTIDSGREMFGNVTPQPPTSEPNGYLALAMFDGSDQLGNEDGVIDSRDLVFSALRLWTDENRDGVSQPWELWRLEAHGIWSIDLDYTTSRRRDRHGNEFRYSSLVRLERGTTQAADVFPMVEE